MKRVVVLGSGGREHALAMKLLKSDSVDSVSVLPGNPGMKVTNGLEVVALKDLEGVSEYIREYQPSLVVIGPETLIEAGWSDAIRKLGYPVFAPSKAAGELESSKIFAKDFMNRNGVPTAKSVTVRNYEEAQLALKKWDHSLPPVIKCDTLAAGKGVVVAATMEEAREAIFNFMVNANFNVHSEELVLEERLDGREMSLFVLSDGDNFQVLGSACDYKRLLDDHKGPNTGGMGCVTPENFPTTDALNFINQEIVCKSFKGLAAESMPFQGVLFIGLMVTDNEARVIEYNVRFGDPETQLLLPNLDVDLYQLLYECATGSLRGSSYTPLKTFGKGVHVVMVSRGYPDLDGSGMQIGEDVVVNADLQGVLTYAGVKEGPLGNLVNSGGRVLGLTVIGPDLEEAREKAYREISNISFAGAHFRRDIGKV